MTTPTPSNALVNVLAEWEDKNGTMAAIMPDEWAGLMRPVMNACMIQSPRQIRRELAAAQERIERLEACVNGEVPEGALKALGRWLAPVLDEDKWATAEKFLNAALLQLLDAQEALKAAEELAESNAKDAERMTFLHERCSVTFTFKRDDGTCAMIAGPTNLRAAIDAARKP